MRTLISKDASGSAPCPEVSNPMRDKLKGLQTLGGVSLAGRFPELTLDAEDGHESMPGLGDYFSVGLLHIVSRKLRNVLECASSDMEFFSVTVQYHGKKLADQFFVANPLCRFKGIDHDRSDVELDEELGDALSVKHLVLDEEKFHNVKIAVVDEIQRIAVTPEIVDAVRRASCVGLVFIDPVTVRY